MMYVDFSAGGKDYKLRLSTRNIVVLEKELGCNPLAILGDGSTFPTVSAMVAILHASLQQLNHGITRDDAYDIFDAWLADGNQIAEFLYVILDVYRISGIIDKDAGVESEKN